MTGFKKFLKKYIWAFIIIFLVIGSLLIYFFTKGKSNATQKYAFVTVEKGSLAKTVSVVGNITAANQQTGTFSGNSGAKVTSVRVKPGDTVKKGQILATTDNTDLNNKYIQASSQLNQAKNDLSSLYAQGHYTVYQLNNVKEQVRTAQANYNLAKANGAAAELKADFNGIVSTVSMQVGTQAGTTSIIVVDPTSYYIDASLSESEIVTVKKNMAATVTFDSLGGKSYIAKVTDIAYSPDISSNVVSYKTRIGITANDGQLRLGFSGKVVVTLETKDDVLILATSAIRTRGTQKYVRVLTNGKEEEKTVEVGLVGDTQTEITSGLSENDQVILSVLTNAAPTTNTNQAPNAIQFGGTGSRTNGTGGTRQIFTPQ